MRKYFRFHVTRNLEGSASALAAQRLEGAMAELVRHLARAAHLVAARRLILPLMQQLLLEMAISSSNNSSLNRRTRRSRQAPHIIPRACRNSFAGKRIKRRSISSPPMSRLGRRRRLRRRIISLS